MLVVLPLGELTESLQDALNGQPASRRVVVAPMPGADNEECDAVLAWVRELEFVNWVFCDPRWLGDDAGRDALVAQWSWALVRPSASRNEYMSVIERLTPFAEVEDKGDRVLFTSKIKQPWQILVPRNPRPGVLPVYMALPDNVDDLDALVEMALACGHTIVRVSPAQAATESQSGSIWKT